VIVTGPDVAPITLGLIAALEQAMGVAIGSGQKPAGATAPYGFLTRGSLTWTGPLGDYSEAQLTYQLQCVALDPADVDLLEGMAGAVFGSPPAIDGWHLINSVPLGSPGIRIERDVDPAAPLFFSTPQWSIWAQPSA
jgi:hypothetical protein